MNKSEIGECYVTFTEEVTQKIVEGYVDYYIKREHRELQLVKLLDGAGMPALEKKKNMKNNDENIL